MHLDETLTYFPLPFLFSNSTFLSPMPTPKHFYLFTCFCSPMSSAKFYDNVHENIDMLSQKKKKKRNRQRKNNMKIYVVSH